MAIGLACASSAALMAAWPDSGPPPLVMLSQSMDSAKSGPSPFETHVNAAGGTENLNKSLPGPEQTPAFESCAKDWAKLVAEAYEYAQRDEGPMDVELAHELVEHATRLMRCSEPDAESAKAAWDVAGAAGALWARSAHRHRALVVWDTRAVNPDCLSEGCDMISSRREPTALEIQAEAERQEKNGYRRAPDLTLQATASLGQSPRAMQWRERLGLPKMQ